MLSITFRTDELTALEAFKAGVIEQNPGGANVLTMVEFIISRAVLPEDQEALNSLARTLWVQPVSQIFALFNQACLASVPATTAALEQVKVEMERRNRSAGCKNDNDSIFDEAEIDGLEM